MMQKIAQAICAVLMVFLTTSVHAADVSMPNTQLTPDFIQKITGKSADELAEMVYEQAYARFNDRFIDQCTKVQVSQMDNQVIFDYLLFDEQCDNQIKNSTNEQIAQHIGSGKAFRVNEIAKTPTAMAMLEGGVVQVYRFYIMPDKTFIGSFLISAEDVFFTRNKQ